MITIDNYMDYGYLYYYKLNTSGGIFIEHNGKFIKYVSLKLGESFTDLYSGPYMDKIICCMNIHNRKNKLKKIW